MGNRGRRYNGEKKLNIKKVFSVIIAIVVLVMIIIAIKNLLTDSKENGKIVPTKYFAVLTNDRWGVIDSKGQIVVNPTYEEMIIVPDNKKDIFICTYDMNYTDGTYKTRVLNKKATEIFSEYDLVEAIDNHDDQNNMWYEQNVLRVKKDNRYGLINFEGKEVLSANYDSITSLKGVTNIIKVEKDGKFGLFDLNGNMIIKTEYDEISLFDKSNTKSFIVKKYNKYGVAGEDELEAKYKEIKQVSGNGMYVVKESDNWKIISKDGATELESDFGDVKSINGDNIIVSKNNKLGVINTQGNQILPIEYQDLIYAFSNYYIAKKDDKYGIINTSNETKLAFKYTQISHLKSVDFIEAWTETNETEIFNNNLEYKLTGLITDLDVDKGYMRIRISEEYKYYNFKFEEKKNTEILSGNTLFLDKKDGKYGFIDLNGKVKVEYIYDDATEQNSFGYAAINKDGKWGCINQNGEIIVEPKYSLQNNLIIDFIDKWHLGEDLNMYYYTDR